uniref:Uncharacterized protein n=1 Tax=viral metagenome TaxID=1070528 RepID=A0A6M3M8E0_9ZZZZ
MKKITLIVILILGVLVLGCVEKVSPKSGTVEEKTAVTENAIITTKNFANKIELSYSKDYNDAGAITRTGSNGLAVRYTLSGEGYVNNIRMDGYRYGTVIDNFDVEIWDGNFNTLYTASYPYDKYFPAGYNSEDDVEFSWVNITIPNVKVKDEFYVALFLYSTSPPWRVKQGVPSGGIFIGISNSNNQRTYEVNKNPNRISPWKLKTSREKIDLMVIATIDGNPTTKISTAKTTQTSTPIPTITSASTPVSVPTQTFTSIPAIIYTSTPTPTIIPTVTPTQSLNGNEPKILSYSSYVDNLGYYTVVGEVQNNLQSNINYVKISATFYDSQNNVIGTDFTYTDMGILKPGQKSPFEISSYPDKISPSNFKLSVSYKDTGNEPYEGLQILSSTSKTDNLGYYETVGEIKNNGNRNSTYVKVIATYYDSTGKVIAKSFTYTNPEDINSGDTAPFKLSSYPDKISPSKHELVVEGGIK